MIRIRDSYQVPGQTRVTWVLVVLNLLSFLSARDVVGVWSLGALQPSLYVDTQALLGSSLNLDGLIPLIWYQFLHGSWWHLLFNLFALILFGPNVEGYMGRARFLMFYLTCGAVGGLLQVLVALGEPGQIIGASGAISGLFGAYWAVFPGHAIRFTFGSLRTGAYRDFLVPVKVILVFWIASQLMDILVPSPYGQIKVAYFTHFGGFVAGYFLAQGRKVLQRNPKSKFKVFPGGKL